MMHSSKRVGAAVTRGTGPVAQRGVSLSGLLVWSVVLIVGALFGFRVGPAYIEYFSLKGVLESAAADPDNRNATPSAIRKSIERRMGVADVKSVHATDIDVAFEGGRLTLSTSWAVKVPIAGNLSACLDFTAVAQK